MTLKDDTPARASLLKLVEHVFENRTGCIGPLTYSELAHRIGRRKKDEQGHGHGMGAVLGKMGHLLEHLAGEWGERIPHIQSLVVKKSGKNEGLPDDGIKEFWPDYPNLTRAEKHRKVRIEYQRVVDFGSRWNDVLKQLGLPPITITDRVRRSKSRFGSTGESEQHKRLKEYVRRNPEIVGANHDWRSYVEYALPTFDEIDVLFMSTEACIAVEVKSVASDGVPSDYERGVFQIVKYSALLSAMASAGAYEIPARIQAVLVLESRLPAEYRALVNALGVKVLEGVNPS